MTDSTEALAAARREARRCQGQLDSCHRDGIEFPRDYWVKRLTDAAKQYEAAAVVLRMQAALLVAERKDVKP